MVAGRVSRLLEQCLQERQGVQVFRYSGVQEG
jgi:hypothetical protein